MRGLFKKKDEEKIPDVSVSHRDISKVNLFKKGVNQMACRCIDKERLLPFPKGRV